MKAADVDEVPILKLLAAAKANDGRWTLLFSTEFGEDDSWAYDMWDAVPSTTPLKVLRAKLRSMKKRKLIDGCDCGCRGDWVITDKGLAHLESRELCG